MTNFQIENQLKQRKESLEKKVKREELLTPVHLQNAYNKENLETQHKYNLEIFEKQKSLTLWASAITSICTIIAAVIGALIGYYLASSQQITKTETPLEKQELQGQLSSVNQKEYSKKTTSSSIAPINKIKNP